MRKLDIFLVFAIALFIVQIISDRFYFGRSIIDVRKWSREVWLGLNVGVLLVLCGIRFGPGLCREWRERRTRLTIEREQPEKQRQLREQREMLERLQRGRTRRIY
jgi:hypothetical protein